MRCKIHIEVFDEATTKLDKNSYFLDSPWICGLVGAACEKARNASTRATLKIAMSFSNDEAVEVQKTGQVAGNVFPCNMSPLILPSSTCSTHDLGICMMNIAIELP